MQKAPTPKRILWTSLDLVKWTADYFKSHRIEHARSEAEILLARTLGVRRIDLYLNHDQPLDQAELARFKTLIKRRVTREPVAYITRMREFWSLELAVDPSVLIPRPETECLVENVLPFLDDKGNTPKKVLDLGTGSGAIVIAMAHEHPEHRYLATDRSAAALQTARKNAHRHGVERCIDWCCADWDAPLALERARFDLIVSNPPYIRRHDIHGLQAEIRLYEPLLALDGSKDGLKCLRHIIGAAYRYLNAGGWLALEMGFDQKSDVQDIVERIEHYERLRFIKDYSGLDRVAMMRKVGGA